MSEGGTRKAEEVPLLQHAGVDSSRTLSMWGAAFTLVAGAVGAGVLALPSVLGKDGQPRAGAAGGFILLMVAVVFQRVANVCISGAIDMSGGCHQSFEALALDVLGVRGQVLAGVMANVTVLGFATCYLIVLGQMVARAASAFGIGSWQLSRNNVEVWSIGLVSLVLLPLVFVPLNEKPSVVAVVAECLILPLIGVVAAAAPGGVPRTLFGPLEQLGPAFCTIVFALGFGFLVPTVKGRMVDPSRMVEACDIALVMCFLIYGSVMGTCYYAWGDENSSNVLERVDGNIAVISDILLLINLVVSYAIMTQTAYGGLSDAFSLTGSRSVRVRCGLGIGCGLVAMVVPCFGEFLDLISALTLVGCNFLLPFACYWVLAGRKVGSRVEAVRQQRGTALVHALVAVGGLLALVFGVWFGSLNLMVAMKKRALSQDMAAA